MISFDTHDPLLLSYCPLIRGARRDYIIILPVLVERALLQKILLLLFFSLSASSIILDLRFPSICYRKLLSPPVVPASNSAHVGVVRNFDLDDLAQFMPVRDE